MPVRHVGKLLYKKSTADKIRLVTFWVEVSWSHVAHPRVRRWEQLLRMGSLQRTTDVTLASENGIRIPVTSFLRNPSFGGTRGHHVGAFSGSSFLMMLAGLHQTMQQLVVQNSIFMQQQQIILIDRLASPGAASAVVATALTPSQI